MLHGRDILCISSIDWDFLWQGHQEIMSSLAQHGNRVLFVENTGVRTPTLRDVPRLWHRLLRWWHSTKGFREESKNLFVFSPLILPFPQSRLAARVNRYLLVRALKRWMRATGFRHPILWTFLPTRLVVELIDALEPELVVYYCIADFGQLAQRPERLARSERQLLDRTDVVFVQGEVLRQRCTPHPNMHIFPFGVSLTTFERKAELAPELRDLARPIVGYVGGIHREVDFRLIEQVARAIDGSVVLVGPIQTDVGKLAKLENVVFVGVRPHHRLPEFIRGFDVGIVPYRLSEYTQTVYPTKLAEYLAAGIPVIATDLPEIRRFNSEYGEVVTVAGDAAEFVRGIRDAATQRSPEEVARRIRAARENSWETRIAGMSGVIEKALEARAQTPGADWERALRQLYRATRARLAKLGGAVAIVFAAYLLIFWTPLPWIMAEPLRIAAEPMPADAIVVLGGGVGESGRGGQGYQERVKRAVDLYRAGDARHIIFSTGWAYTFRETELMRALAMSLGVPREAILLEDKAGSTYENVKFVKPILNTHGWTKVLLVSSPYHMRRVLATFHKIAPEFELVPTPVAGGFYRHSWGATLPQVRGILHEELALAYYWWKGWI